MIRHIVLWTLKDGPGVDKAANARRVKAALEGCAEVVPGIRSFEVGLSEAGLEADADVALVAEFEDAAALAAYQAHPRHQEVKRLMAEVRETRLCMDYAR
jgi:heme-degrading monooxygenase HmoA